MSFQVVGEDLLSEVEKIVLIFVSQTHMLGQLDKVNHVGKFGTFRPCEQAVLVKGSSLQLL